MEHRRQKLDRGGGCTRKLFGKFNSVKQLEILVFKYLKFKIDRIGIPRCDEGTR